MTQKLCRLVIQTGLENDNGNNLQSRLHISNMAQISICKNGSWNLLFPDVKSSTSSPTTNSKSNVCWNKDPCCNEHSKYSILLCFTYTDAVSFEFAESRKWYLAWKNLNQYFDWDMRVGLGLHLNCEYNQGMSKATGTMVQEKLVLRYQTPLTRPDLVWENLDYRETRWHHQSSIQ